MWKNIIQEYCQKNNLEFPKYDTHKISTTENNQIIWKCSINFKNYPICYGIDLTKKGAEIKAAAELYTFIDKSVQEKVKQYKRTQKSNDIKSLNFRSYDRIILVDGENCDFEIKKLNSKDLICIFVAKNTSKNIVFEHQEEYENCHVFISECVGKDAADHLLTFYAGILSVIHPDGKYIILTKDHYGEFLEKFMRNCKFICSLDEL
ncbi:double-stranded RNA binding motif-containing protein [Indivirus ILV1]|uniref:Double-stranded RNA binding motif-containing protein n=1 Tax=Indivirus ILV1 TaxID=1977633 RepID=A0A1V0SD20_9VIRU|nr:double-stranded RNA binding motif-containing protein [Indivirus ILV1]